MTSTTNGKFTAEIHAQDHVHAHPTHAYRCINCTKPVESLFVVYLDPGNTSLLECPHCSEPSADRFVEHTFSVLLVDLLLFKPRVYRHLIYNRGSGDAEERRKERERSTFGLGAAVISLDAYIRCANVPTDQPFLSYFVITLMCCILETLSLHTSIAVSAIITERVNALLLPLIPPPTTLTQTLSSLRLLSLTLFYTSLPTLFLLSISLIWSSEYSLPTPPLPLAMSTNLPLPFSTTMTTFVKFTLESLSYAARGHLRTGSGSIEGEIGGWASEAVLRKGVGGSSAVVGLSVLLEVSKTRTMVILLLAWSIHLTVLLIIDPWLI